MPGAVGRVGVAVEHVPAGKQVRPEVGLARVDAGVEDGDGDSRALRPLPHGEHVEARDRRPRGGRGEAAQKPVGAVAAVREVVRGARAEQARRAVVVVGARRCGHGGAEDGERRGEHGDETMPGDVPVIVRTAALVPSLERTTPFEPESRFRGIQMMIVTRSYIARRDGPRKRGPFFCPQSTAGFAAAFTGRSCGAPPRRRTRRRPPARPSDTHRRGRPEGGRAATPSFDRSGLPRTTC